MSFQNFGLQQNFFFFFFLLLTRQNKNFILVLVLWMFCKGQTVHVQHVVDCTKLNSTWRLQTDSYDCCLLLSELNVPILQAKNKTSTGKISVKLEVEEVQYQKLSSRRRLTPPLPTDRLLKRSRSRSSPNKKWTQQKHWRRSPITFIYFVLINEPEEKTFEIRRVLHCKGFFFFFKFSYNAFLIYKPWSRTKRLHLH